ncbi:MAG: 50S ribosomal protein L4 [Phycisphaerae bacterium]|nr:50S ribosomal protein L4 [Phycisphaerales bacterium]MCK6475569.1 50S ribosomal protein L4 [Phycisphaerales bacterium]
MDVAVYNIQGSQVGTLTIDPKTLGEDINAPLIKQAYVMYHANLRQGSSKTLNRGNVEGSTKKLYKQKGTGNARHGDRKVNIFKGGGHGHSKKRTRDDFRLTMPKKMRRRANRNAFLAKLVDNEVRVIDNLSFSSPRTRDFRTFLDAVKIDASALVALSMDESRANNTRLSARNLDGVSLCRADQLNCFDMLNHRYLVIGRDDLEAWLKGPQSQTGKDAKITPLGRAPASAQAPKAARPEKTEKPRKTKAAK